MENAHETILTIEGMTCGACVRHVRDALRAVAGVSDAEVDLEQGTACILHDPAAAPVERLIGAVAKAGYGATESR